MRTRTCPVATLCFRSGAASGEDYGPVLVARDRVRVDQLAGARIAVPGILTTAFLVLRLFDPGVRYQVVAFDRILDAVRHNEVEAGC